MRLQWNHCKEKKKGWPWTSEPTLYLPPPPPSSPMKESLLGYALLKDLFLRHNVQVCERGVQQVEVSVFIHGSEGETHRHV